jgi:hypothetical protein
VTLLHEALVVNERIDPLSPPASLPIQPAPSPCLGWVEARGKGIYSLRCRCCSGVARAPLHSWRAA